MTLGRVRSEAQGLGGLGPGGLSWEQLEPLHHPTAFLRPSPQSHSSGGRWPPYLSSGATKKRRGLCRVMTMRVAATHHFPCWWSECPSEDRESPAGNAESGAEADVAGSLDLACGPRPQQVAL